MKTLRISIILFFTPLLLLAQVEEKENSSGKQSFSISKENKVENSSGKLQFNITSVKVSERNAKETFNVKRKDETVPIIKIISPQITRGFKAIEDNEFTTITGKIEDESGIFKVTVNDINAEVSAEGLFQATIPLAYGDNTIVVTATDIKQNSGQKEFIIERKTTIIINEPIVNKTENQIIWQSPAQINFTTSVEKYTIQACIKSGETIKEIKLLQNDWFVSSYTPDRVEFQGECNYNVNEPILLKYGLNQMKIEVITETTKYESAVNINCKMIGANYKALIIGVQDYQDPEINDLSQPINDAQKLYDILTKEYTFEPTNVVFLKNPTKSEIIGTLHKMRSTITENDNLLIFYAGHGYWDEAMNNGYWLPSDANQDNPVNWLPNTDLTNYLNVIKSKHTLLIADACFSGGIFKTRKAFNNTYAIEKLYKLPSRKAITSGTLKEVPDKSVFLQYFLKRLTENTDKYLSAEQLYSSLRMAVINNSPNIPQYGTIQNVGDEGGDFIFIRRD
ncbi:caspase family protein [Bacteroidota bacterium]